MNQSIIKELIPDFNQRFSQLKLKFDQAEYQRLNDEWAELFIIQSSIGSPNCSLSHRIKALQKEITPNFKFCYQPDPKSIDFKEDNLFNYHIFTLIYPYLNLTGELKMLNVSQKIRKWLIRIKLTKEFNPGLDKIYSSIDSLDLNSKHVRLKYIINYFYGKYPQKYRDWKLERDKLIKRFISVSTIKSITPKINPELIPIWMNYIYDILKSDRLTEGDIVSDIIMRIINECQTDWLELPKKYYIDRTYFDLYPDESDCFGDELSQVEPLEHWTQLKDLCKDESKTLTVQITDSEIETILSHLNL